MLTENSCIHCGADCGKHPVIWESKKFCCNGCKQVYLILNENKLAQYYKIESTPGLQLDQAPPDSKYSYLDKSEVQEKLFEFHENDIAKVRFFIPGIHCASCIWLLENLYKLNTGVKHAAVNFIKKEYAVSFNTKEISLRELVELLSSIHYIPDISLNSLEKDDNKPETKKLLYKIGVAGFVFGNVMLYSLPEYFNGEPLDESLGNFLNYLSFILIIPLVFFSGSDYILSAYKNLKKGIVNVDLPIAIGILTLFGVTSYEVLSGTGPGYSDSLSGFLFFLLIGKWYQNKTYQALSFNRDYKSYFPIAVTRISDGIEENVLLDEIRVGDHIKIRNKELIPADSNMISGQALVDYSFVTGESTPVRKKVGEPVYAGGVQTAGSITIQVSTEVKQSHLTQLWNQSEDRSEKKSSLVSIIDKVSVYFTVSIISIALIGFGIWLFLDGLSAAIMVLTSVLIVACPCALALSLPFTFGSSMRILGQKGFYIKNTSVIEKLTRIDSIVFDKTGTLTKPDENKIEFVGTSLTREEMNSLSILSSQSTHPLSQALARHFPCSEEALILGFVEVSGRGIFAKVNNVDFKIGSGEYVSSPEQDIQESGSMVHVSIDNVYKGYFVISNRYRDGFSHVINNLARSFTLYLLSGDRDTERMRLEKFFDSGKMLFNQKPIEKMEFIQDLQKNGANVLMTGDGLNDSGAFIESDVALSLADDIYHFSPAGDAILEARRFDQLDKYIQFARKSLSIVKVSFAISILYNIVGLSFAITGNLSPVVAAILMPISSISVVAFATFSTGILGRKLK